MVQVQTTYNFKLYSINTWVFVKNLRNKEKWGMIAKVQSKLYESNWLHLKFPSRIPHQRTKRMSSNLIIKFCWFCTKRLKIKFICSRKKI